MNPLLPHMKKRSIATFEEALSLERAVSRSARKALERIVALHESSDALRALWEMKFRPVGCDPLDADTPLNLIEQLNQTFTYIASARGAQLLFKLHPALAPFNLNLGNVSGSDIESSLPGKLACEVFAAVNTANNQKLRKDVAKVGGSDAQRKYVFFMCPGFALGRQPQLERRPDVEVWSVGSGPEGLD